ncbi:MAG: GAF domain-containing protein [Anaerolineae bacterium]|nr:GAF domain-containing protein [Anaerolineae bacterium]
MANELVLVINDQTEIRELIVNRILIPYGYRPYWAVDASSGVAAAERDRPDVVIVDLDMPLPGDKHVLEMFKEKGYDIPAIALISDQTRAMDVQHLFSLVCACVHKPVQVEAMLSALDQVLADVRLRARLPAVETQFQQHIQQPRLLYVAAQTVMSAVGEQQVLDRLVSSALNIADADEAVLFVQDPESTALLARAYLHKDQQPGVASQQPAQDPLIEQVVESGELTILSRADAVAAQAPFPVSIMVPIKVHGGTVGVLRVSRLDPEHEFEITHAYWISALAGYAATVLETERLKTWIDSEFERMTAYRIGSTFGSTLRLDALLDLVIAEALQVTEAARGYIALFDEHSGLYSPVALRGIDKKTIESVEFKLGRYVVRHVLEEGELLQVPPDRLALPHAEALSVALVCVPLRGAAGIIGAIYVDRPNSERLFASKQIQLFKVLATQAAVTIENAKLFGQVESERRKLEAVIRGTDQPVVVTDTQGTVMLMNSTARQIFHTQRAMGTGMLLPQVIDNADLKRLFHEARTSGHVQRGEIQLEGKRTFNATVTPISDVGLVAMLQDITQFKELSNLKSEFVATVSHDLRSPLSTVLSFLDVLGQIGPLNDQQKDFVDSAQQQVRHLIGLTGDLLDLGYLESGIDMDMRQCDLCGLIESGLPHWQTQAREHQHQLEAHLPSTEVIVYGNATRLRQVIDNLIINAVKYTPEGGQITIRLERQGKRVFLRVQDTGIGIAPEDLPHVFDQFYRVYNDYTRDIAGTGLGLSIVKSIVDRHNGRVWVESELGQGSTFVVALAFAG